MPARGVKRIEVVPPGEIKAVTVPAVVLDPVNKHMQRQNAIVERANPAFARGWPEIESGLRGVGEVISLIANSLSNQLVVYKPSNLTWGPLDGECVVAVCK